MNTRICTLLFLFASIVNQSNAQAHYDSTQYVYCELVGTQRLLSTKVTITIDFGEHLNLWKDNRVKDEQTGKVKLFNSMVDALNFMGEDGWEFVQAYVVTTGQQNVYHWLLKRRRYELAMN